MLSSGGLSSWYLGMVRGEERGERTEANILHSAFFTGQQRPGVPGARRQEEAGWWRAER